MFILKGILLIILPLIVILTLYYLYRVLKKRNANSDILEFIIASLASACLFGISLVCLGIAILGGLI